MATDAPQTRRCEKRRYGTGPIAPRADRPPLGQSSVVRVSMRQRCCRPKSSRKRFWPFGATPVFDPRATFSYTVRPFITNTARPAAAGVLERIAVKA
jgi:hypothetical protein